MVHVPDREPDSVIEAPVAKLTDLNVFFSRLNTCFWLAGLPPVRARLNVDWQVQWSLGSIASPAADDMVRWHLHLDGTTRRAIYSESNFLPLLHGLVCSGYRSLNGFDVVLSHVHRNLLASLEDET